MSDWGGFTDADLQKLKGHNDTNKRTPKIVKPVKKNPMTNNAQRRIKKPQIANKKPDNISNVPAQAMLSRLAESPSTPTDPASALHGKTKTTIESPAIKNTDTEKEPVREVKIIEDENVIKE